MDKNSSMQNGLGAKAFIPLAVFLVLYLGSGLIFTITGASESPWNEFPRQSALIIAILVAFLMNRKMKISEKVDSFCKDAGKSGTMMMCLIFLLAGTFSGVCDAIGGVDSVVNLGLSIIPTHFMLPGIFIISAAIATAIGTSAGTTIAIAPIAIEVAESLGVPVEMYVAAVVAGALFGDNLSIISDTTIAATRGVGCEMRDKFIMNFKIALPAAAVAVVVFFVLGINNGSTGIIREELPYNVLLIIPYVYVLVAAILGMDVMMVLFSGTFVAGLLGIATSTLTPIGFVQSMGSGMEGMMSTAVIAIMIQGMLGIIARYGGMEWLIGKMRARIRTRKGAEYCIAVLAAVMAFCLINNTVAIMAVAPLAKDIADEYHIAPKRVASLLDIFACGGLGLAPHANVMMVLVGFYPLLNPIGVIAYSTYPILLMLATIITIHFGLLRTPEEKEAAQAEKRAKLAAKEK